MALDMRLRNILPGLGGWIRTRANAVERTLAVIGGLLLFFAGPRTDLAGLVLFGAGVAIHLRRTRAGSPLK
jgi:hypothetical protein